MSSKNKRLGGKYCGSHTTVIPAAAILTDIAHRKLEVSKILLGYIKAGLNSVNGQKRVKLTDCEGSVLLSVRDNTTHQEVRIYTSNNHETKLSIAREARNNGLAISFGKSVVQTTKK